MISQRSVSFCRNDRKHRACFWPVISWLICLFLSCSVHASVSAVTHPPVTSVDPDADYQLIEMLFAQDTSTDLSIEDIRQSDVLNWQPALDEYIEKGVGPDVYWYRFNLENLQSHPVKTLIEIAYPLLDFVDYYRFSQTSLVETIHTGDRVAFDQRAVDHPNFLFPVTLNAGEQQTIYLRIKTNGAHIVPIKAWQPEAHLAQSGNLILFHGVYFGFSGAVVFLYLLLAIWLRESMYLNYALSIGLVAIYFGFVRGLFYPLVFSDSPDVHHFVGAISVLLGGIFGGYFARQFMSLPQHSKGLDRLLVSAIALQVFCVLAYLFLDATTWLKLLMLTGMYIGVVALTVCLTAWYKGLPNALPYTLAFSMIMIFWVVGGLSRFDVIPVSFITEYGSQIGSLLETVVLTVVLSYQVHREHKDKVAAQEAQLAESEVRIQAETDLLHKSMTHAVTNLPNRTSFEEQLQQTIIHREDRRIAVVVVEITRYTEISKTLGHQNTDLLVKEFAQRYTQGLASLPGILEIEGPSSTAFACSLENPSFGLMMNADVVAQNIETIRAFVETMRKPIEFNGMLLDLDVVTGVAICPEHGVDAVTLIRHAGVAVDSVDAKEKGLAYFQPEQDQYNTRRLTMISDLKQAIDNNELELFLQPKYDPALDKVVGAEALLRWQHKLYGYIRPDEFIPVAEKTGIIKTLTRWVFQQALRQQRELKNKGYDIKVSINVSAANLREHDLVSFLASALEEHETDPQTVYVELTETAMMKDPDSAVKKLEKIRALGLKVSVDDFGAGYSSLSYLDTLPANEIKLDRALIVRLENNLDNHTVVKSTIEMSHKLGFSVVAEGVETAEMMKVLTELDCDLIQGYLLTPPLPQDQFLNWLESHQSKRFVS